MAAEPIAVGPGMGAFGELRGQGVVCTPLRPGDVEELLEAASEDRSTFAYLYVPATRAEMAAYVAQAIARREERRELGFAIRDGAGRVVGSTSFLDLQRFSWDGERPVVSLPGPGEAPSVCEIGATWLRPSAQRTFVNTACKLLLLGQAFDGWGVGRVTFKTDARNARSRRAIERLGARFDGELRHHLPAPGHTVRDTAYYSILAGEWPAIASRLGGFLAR